MIPVFNLILSPLPPTKESTSRFVLCYFPIYMTASKHSESQQICVGHSNVEGAKQRVQWASLSYLHGEHNGTQ